MSEHCKPTQGKRKQVEKEVRGQEEVEQVLESAEMESCTTAAWGKKNTPKHTRWAWIHICPSRAKFSRISWADLSRLILSVTYGYHNQMSADKRKHSCSHGNRGFWDMMMPRMDTGWANKQFKVKLNFSMVALHILFSQFLHATNLMDVLLTCFWFYFGTKKTKKTNTNQYGHVVQWKKTFQFIVIVF